MKWISVLAMLSVLSGCMALSDDAYNLTAYTPGGKEIRTGMYWQGYRSEISTARDAVCRTHPGAIIVFKDIQTLKTQQPYKCGGEWDSRTETVATAGKGADYVWEDEVWKKRGADKLAAWKALLECGAPNLSPKITDMSDNEYMLMSRCMTKSGFKNIQGEKALFQCKNYPNLPACQSEAVIPARSEQRRLDSDFCREFKNAPACRP